jgi:hypothetical protein
LWLLTRQAIFYYVSINYSQYHLTFIDIIWSYHSQNNIDIAAYIPLSLEIDLKFEENEEIDSYILGEEDVKVHLIKTKYLEEARKAHIESFETIDDLDTSTEPDKPFSDISNIIDTLMRGAQSVSLIKELQSESHQVDYTITEISENKIKIEYLDIIVNEPGEYSLLYSINGIYSGIETTKTDITVKDDIPNFVLFIDWAGTSIMIAFYFIILLFSNKFIKGYLLALALVFIIVFIVFQTYQDDGTTLFYKLALYTFVGFLTIIILKNIYVSQI